MHFSPLLPTPAFSAPALSAPLTPVTNLIDWLIDWLSKYVLTYMHAYVNICCRLFYFGLVCLHCKFLQSNFSVKEATEYYGWRHTGLKTGAGFRSRKSEPTFGTCVMRKRFSTLIRTCSISRSIFGSTWSIETVVIGLSSLFSFGLFVNSAESVNKHIDYIF